MRRDRLDYGRLEAEERFRLTVAAKARADTSETQRLVRSCPRQSYVGADRKGVELPENADALAIVVLADLGSFESALNALEIAWREARIAFAISADEAEYEAYLA